MAKPVLVKMYNVGFGDCFLIEFPVLGKRPKRVLIDCGSIDLPDATPMKNIVNRILDDTREADGLSYIDVIVCTHRHADHVSGFGNELWRDVQVQEVWFPWTENPKDQQANAIRNDHQRLAIGLNAYWETSQAAFKGIGKSIAVNALTNEKAMTMLHRGFKSKPRLRFLTSDGSADLIETGVLGEVETFVLGPSKSAAVIKAMNPPGGATFLKQTMLSDTAETGDTNASKLFGPQFVLNTSSVDPHLMVTQEDSKRLKEISGSWIPTVAAGLDSAVNGTSLILAFEIGEAVLLFPGDAQWGPWREMMDRSSGLLERVTFWKVGHHGSHNATPVQFVELLKPINCCAMMSTNATKFDSIPRQPLLDRLIELDLEHARSDIEPDGSYQRFNKWTPTMTVVEVPI